MLSYLTLHGRISLSMLWETKLLKRRAFTVQAFGYLLTCLFGHLGKDHGKSVWNKSMLDTP